jgi:hypothetical protein
MASSLEPPASAPSSLLCSPRTTPARLALFSKPSEARSPENIAGRSLNTPNKPVPMACNACSRGRSGMKMAFAMRCEPTLCNAWAHLPSCRSVRRAVRCPRPPFPCSSLSDPWLSQTGHPLGWGPEAVLRRDRTGGELSSGSLPLLRDRPGTRPSRSRIVPARRLVHRRGSPAGGSYPANGRFSDQARIGPTPGPTSTIRRAADQLGGGRYGVRTQHRLAALAGRTGLALRAGCPCKGKWSVFRPPKDTGLPRWQASSSRRWASRTGSGSR